MCIYVTGISRSKFQILLLLTYIGINVCTFIKLKFKTQYDFQAAYGGNGGITTRLYFFYAPEIEGGGEILF
jgi:hypothetical protein